MKTTLFKNTLAALAALFIATFALPQQAQAEDYALYVAGVQVTSANCADLSVIPGVTGTAKYDPATKTLTLDNATISATENKHGIVGIIDGLTVEVKGTVNVTAQSGSALMFYKSAATVMGGGTFNATSDGDCGICALNTDLTIDGLTVNAKGKWGITGWNSTVESLTIRNATVTAKGNGTKGSICDFKTLTLDGCEITAPAGAAFDPSLKGVALNGQLVKTSVDIMPIATPYDLYVAGVQVTSRNCNDISYFPGVTGDIGYDHATKTLTLSYANIDAYDKKVIDSRIDGLTVQLYGNSTVTTFGTAIEHTKPMTITGSGTLDIDGGIFVNKTALTIDGCTVDTKGGYYGISGYDGTVESLTVRNANVTAKGVYGSICELKTLTLDGCEITQPAGAAFNPSLKGVALNGKLVETKVKISPKPGGIILSEGFEKLSLPAGWTNIDADGQDNGWKVVEFENGDTFLPHSGQYCISSASYINHVGAQTPDNWLVTPRLNLPSGGVLSFWVCAQDYSAVAEKYAVYVSTTGNDQADFTQKLHEETLTEANNQGNYKEVKLNLPAGTRYVAFRHYDCTDQYWINIDDVVIQSESTPVLGFAVIDEVKKPILSYKYFDEGDNNFILRFYLSADGKEMAQVEGDRNLHTGKDIDLTKRESLHEGWYWCVAYATDFISWDNCHRVFIGLGNPNSDAPVFTAGTLRIDGDPAGTFTVSLKNGRITTDTTWGDGKEHTVSINCSNDPTGIETVTADASVKRQGTYNLQGVKLNTAFDRLPAGIYIVDGKKVVKK